MVWVFESLTPVRRLLEQSFFIVVGGNSLVFFPRRQQFEVAVPSFLVDGLPHLPAAVAHNVSGAGAQKHYLVRTRALDKARHVIDTWHSS